MRRSQRAGHARRRNKPKSYADVVAPPGTDYADMKWNDLRSMASTLGVLAAGMNRAEVQAAVAAVAGGAS